jgi:hypothetical protein
MKNVYYMQKWLFKIVVLVIEVKLYVCLNHRNKICLIKYFNSQSKIFLLNVQLRMKITLIQTK